MIKIIKNLPLNVIIAYIYATVLVGITMVPYLPSNALAVIFSIFAEFGVFTILYNVKDSIRKLICVVSFLISFAIMIFAFTLNISGTNFYSWLLTGYDYNVMYIPYIFLLFVVVVMFMGTTVFYFNYFYYRGYIMLWILMIPVALYYKMSERVPVIYIIAFIIIFFIMYIYQIQVRNINETIYIKNTNINDALNDLIVESQSDSNKEKRNDIFDLKNYESKKSKFKTEKNIRFGINGALKKGVVIILGFMIFVGIITPKAEMAKYRDKFDEYVSFMFYKNKGIRGLEEVSEKSSAGSYGVLNQDRVLYYIYSFDEELYLRRTSFYKYDGEAWNCPQNGMKSNLNNLKEYKSSKTFYNTMIGLYDKYPEIFEKYGVVRDDIFEGTEVINEARIYPTHFSPNYVLNTVGTFEVNKIYGSYDEPTRNTLKNFDGDHRLRQSVFGCIQTIDTSKIDSFSIKYYSNDVRKDKRALNFASKFSGDEYEKFIGELIEKEEDTKVRGYLSYVFMEIRMANATRSVNQDYSKRLKELAFEITKNARTDYEKAVELEKYFINNDFTYSLSYEPEDDSIEYFVFESKTGACGQYATAMTLMAQSIGLNARYTEGFAYSRKYEDRYDVILAGESHAYVEIYLPGSGYVVFEPTVSNASNLTEGAVSNFFNNISEAVEVSSTVFVYIIASIIVIFVIFSLLKLALWEKMYDAIVIRRSKNRKDGEHIIYSHLQKIVSVEDDVKVESLTPMELGELIFKQYGIDVSELTQIIEMKAYGGKNCKLRDDFYKGIKMTIKKMRKINKNEAKRKIKDEKINMLNGKHMI